MKRALTAVTLVEIKWMVDCTTRTRPLRDVDGELLLGDQPWRMKVTELAAPLFELRISEAVSVNFRHSSKFGRIAVSGRALKRPRRSGASQQSVHP